MEGQFRVLIVDNGDWVRPESLGLLLKKALQVDKVESFHQRSIDEAYKLFCDLEAVQPIDLLIVDSALPETAKEGAAERRTATAGCEFGRTDYSNKMGGFKLVGLILDHLRCKSGNSTMMLNFPTLYLNGWNNDPKKFQGQIKLYHRSLTFDWLDKPFRSDELISVCVELIETYDLCFKRRESPQATIVPANQTNTP